MKRSKAHEVTLRAVLGMLFMYLWSSFSETADAENTASIVCVCKNHASVPYTDTQNMQNSLLNSLFAA